MFRDVRVGKGFLKKTLSYAINNAKFGDRIIIEDIDSSKETKKNFTIPKDIMLEIKGNGDIKTKLKGYHFEVYGSLTISNIDFEDIKEENIFNINNGYLSLYSVEFKDIPEVKSKVFPIYIDNGTKLSVISSYIPAIYSRKSEVNISYSHVNGGSFTEDSEWIIENSYLNNRYIRDQFTIRNSKIKIENTEFKGYPDILSGNYPFISLKESNLFMKNSEITFDSNLELKGNYYLLGMDNTTMNIQDSKVDAIGVMNSKLNATEFKTSLLHVFNKSNLKVSSLVINEIVYEKYHPILFNNNSYGNIHLLEAKVSSIKVKLEDSKLEMNIEKYDNNITIYKDSKSEVETNDEIEIINTDEDKSKTKENVTSNTKEKSPMDELKSLIGLTNAKQQAIDFIRVHQVNNFKKERGFDIKDTTLHSVYKGNPGTGKTTVARLIAKILAQENIIKKDLLVEVSRQDLVAGFVGQTAIKTENVLKSALGGVLFIDEAYTLYSKSEKDYGLEAIETILKFMEDNRDDIMIIFAGYTKEMDDLISMNPGLESRIQNEIIFEDYTLSEMALIGEKMLYEYSFNKDVYEMKLKEKFGQQKINSNARFVRNLNDKILRNQANRIIEDDVMNEEYNLIRDVDILNV